MALTSLIARRVLRCAGRRQSPILGRAQQTTCRSMSVKSADRRHSPFVTTPIYYVNSKPHIGHVYSTVMSDVLFRWHKQECGALASDLPPVFSTGTDEHGLKIQQAAQAAGHPPQQHCDTISAGYKALFDSCDVSYTNFVRTTSPEHRRTVEHFWNVLVDGGHIYKGSFSGWYSVSDETFVPDIQTELVEDEEGNELRVVSESGGRVEWLEEENYMFRLNRFVPQLLDWLGQSNVIQPPSAVNVLLNFFSGDVNDLSVSRSRSRLDWGIPVPGDESHTIYVWLDALVNYLTVAGYPDNPRFAERWPPTIQVVGQDILKFHAIYWPAFLLAAGLELPKQILAHSHFTMGQKKMSKSRGNVYPADELIDEFGLIATRYYLSSAHCFDSKHEFSPVQIKQALNMELANNYGNLLLRIMSKKCLPVAEYPAMPLPHLPQFKECNAAMACEWVFHSLPGCEGDLLQLSVTLLEALVAFPDAVEDCLSRSHLPRAIALAMELLQHANAVFHNFEPWRLVKGNSAHCEEKLAFCNRLCLEALVSASIVLHPVLPQPVQDILGVLGVDESSCSTRRMHLFRGVLLGDAEDTVAGTPIKRTTAVPFQKFDLSDESDGEAAA